MKYQQKIQNPYRGLVAAIVIWAVFSAYQIIKFAAGHGAPSLGHLILADIVPYAILVAVIYGIYLLILRSTSGKSFSELFTR
ncbi:MAG: hypothetical protein Q3962_04325 [Corynebacterium sp.]|nr:hypothetical protein [Corynebacterium sp.]